ncbi:xyloglucan-specific galacturonosyltransferase 1-like [Telopea speciosissima]|uniref:xyloglucan-specific galacturonosyltransferase 1-like n=1 Tax=Telopea speciosissima TaxID=54955 RepID=UPI001CC74BDD|nr:xyloglucan-specific galacturonosyltransferase 1-like [Telopea speciosissima]
MAVSVSKRRGSVKDGKKPVEVAEVGLMSTILCGMLYRIPMLFLLSIFLFIWSSSSIIMSGSFFHVCVSSRKLSDLYCLSAGTHPSFHLPIPLNHTSNNESGKVFDAIRSSFDAINTTTSGSIHDDSWSTSGSAKDDRIDNYSSGSNQDSNAGAANQINDDLDSKIANAKAVEEQLQLHHPFSSDKKKKRTQSNGNDSKNSGNDDRETTIAKAVKAVEEQLQIHRSWASGSSIMNHQACDGRGVFVYDLPSKFNKDLLGHCGDMMPWEGSSFCEYMENEAMGRPIPALGKGWYRTHQYSLEPMLHAKVLKHPCRVYNPDEAKLFYVPYYGGLDILRWHFKKNTTDDVKDALGLELLNWLGTQKSWDRNNGKDHVFVLGKISWDFRRTVKAAWGTGFLHLEQMQNPIKLLIERQPWEINDIGIPHPTNFHPQSDDDIIAWQSKIISSSRKTLVTFAGAERPEDPYNTRSLLINHCTSRTDGACRFLDCKSGGCNKPETLIELFMESEFCLQPPGDSPTRKSVFDSLIAGCIPVLFDPFTAFYQYPWHLPEDHGKYSVFMGKEQLKQMNLNVVENLKEVPKTLRDEMRRFIVYELLPGLVYGDSNAQLQRFQDAFSLSINHLLNRVSKLE